LNPPVTIVDPSDSVLTDSGLTVDELAPDDCVAHGMDGAAITGLAPTPRLKDTIARSINLSIR
jgi:hypothetical protein